MGVASMVLISPPTVVPTLIAYVEPTRHAHAHGGHPPRAPGDMTSRVLVGPRAQTPGVGTHMPPHGALLKRRDSVFQHVLGS